MAEQAVTRGDELDVRQVPKLQRHPLIFARFAALPPGGSFVLVNGHDPKHLRQEFDRDHPGSYGWDYLDSGPVWRIRISRRSSTALPQILGNAATIATDALPADAAGAVWSLPIGDRQLDANIIHLQPAGRIESHLGPDLDVLLLVLAGAGELHTEADPLALQVGALVWLPRRSRRAVTAGPDGLSYLTVHPRRPALRIGATAEH